MAKVNIDKIRTLTGEIRAALKNLKEYALFSGKEVISNPTLFGSIKYNLIVVIQGCIDICSHICGKRVCKGA